MALLWLAVCARKRPISQVQSVANDSSRLLPACRSFSLKPGVALSSKLRPLEEEEQDLELAEAGKQASSCCSLLPLLWRARLNARPIGGGARRRGRGAIS